MREEAEILVEIGNLLTELSTVRGETENPYVSAWFAVMQVDSVELSREGAERIEYARPHGQSTVQTVGLISLAFKEDYEL